MTASRPREHDVVVERDGEGLYVASMSTLPGCHTQARSLDDLMERIEAAIELSVKGHRGADSGLGFVAVQRVRLASYPGLLGQTSPAHDRPSAAIW